MRHFIQWGNGTACLFLSLMRVGSHQLAVGFSKKYMAKNPWAVALFLEVVQAHGRIIVCGIRNFFFAISSLFSQTPEKSHRAHVSDFFW